VSATILGRLPALVLAENILFIPFSCLLGWVLESISLASAAV
jgi:hypothetical protein